MIASYSASARMSALASPPAQQTAQQSPQHSHWITRHEDYDKDECTEPRDDAT
ncbi:hypothetical protein Psi02_77120 [Planotetraspora silvatica]|uniref:Uncharacterized protein n=1 Tax=Planotetraspora silvatica TaxID=234614 RepID=A0A8J3XW46_9ACTN|nr:hypothetical protein Psi02_77120 [Planotetraspora silvatica]